VNNIDLSNEVVENLCQSFARLPTVPEFSVSEDIDVSILFFKRKDKYFGVRTGLKTEFSSREEFLVYSFLVEELPVRTMSDLSMQQLNVESCSNTEIENIYCMSKNIDKHFPHRCNVYYSCTVVNKSQLNWVFLEEETKYHSVFWSESESKLFSHCA